jgi:hypothetical protein
MMGIFSNFTGGESRDDLTSSHQKAQSALQGGYRGQKKYYQQAINTNQPFLEGGQAGFQAYGDALGLNGQDKQQAAAGNYFNDPAFAGQESLAQNRMLRMLNARGVSDSGAANLAQARVMQENYGNYLNRLAGYGQQGQQAAGVQSQLQATMGDNRYGYGATRAGMDINYGNAMAQTRSTGLNNLMGIAGMATNLGAAYLGKKG